MKATSLKTAAVMAASVGLLAGSATAQGTAVSGVVGYETLALEGGFNFVGVRLHEAPIASGDLETITASTVVDDDVNLAALIVSGTYILEIEDGSGIIQEVTSGDGGTGLTIAADLTGLATPLSYSLRPASTLASIFGAANESGLATGSFGASADADEVWIWNGADFDRYYYDTFNGTSFQADWTNVTTLAPVDPTTIDLIYADGFVINSKSGNDVVVTGDLKATATEIGITGGFNFVGSVAPVGATIETAFGAANEAGLATGSFGASADADEVWIWNGSDFDKYYYDTFNGTSFQADWTNVDTLAPVVASSVALDSGYVINGKGGKNVIQGVPSFYSGL